MSKTIAIIGGGASGALVVLNILKQSTIPIHVLWFDEKQRFGKGLAYSTLDRAHLLNVKVSNMSVFEEEPLHFFNWLQKNNQSYDIDSFVPRCVYGKYITDTLHDLMNSNKLVTIDFIEEEVIAVNKNENFEIKTPSEVRNADQLVLAFGNFLPRHPRSLQTEFENSAHYFRNAFDEKLVNSSILKNDVTIIGSGLTMIDVVVSLHQNNYKGKIKVISPHGYIPKAHSEQPLPIIKIDINVTKKYSLLEIVRLVNQQLKNAKKNNTNWHFVIDALRPFVQNLWQNFTLKDKQKFLRHLRHKWGVARHRASSESIGIINQLLETKQLKVIKGRIELIKTKNNGFDVHYKTISNENLKFETEVIINCTGPESDFEKVEMPLIKQLLKDKIIAVDELHYGIKANAHGEISKNTFTLGSSLKGLLWESTAIPEIRVQAKNIATILLSK